MDVSDVSDVSQQLISSVHSKLLSFSLLNHKTLPTPLPPPTFPSNTRDIGSLIDHTMLKVTTTEEDIVQLCEEGKRERALPNGRQTNDKRTTKY